MNGPDGDTPPPYGASRGGALSVRCGMLGLVTDDEPSYTTRALTPETWDDFAALVEANNGVWGGCWCMGFHPEGVGNGRTASGNREAKRAHVDAGTVRQTLVYDG